jgi:hypothetical protein
MFKILRFEKLNFLKIAGPPGKNVNFENLRNLKFKHQYSGSVKIEELRNSRIQPLDKMGKTLYNYNLCLMHQGGYENITW